ncbi:MAG: hypothetical protein IT375_34895 [Polyangiaceae bacterium]|nr:hypothetical protein [Polyangiaceae bacterium]
MALRAGHGNGKGSPRIEVLPVDELPQGVQGLALVPSTGERQADGTFLPGARTAQRAGGLAHREQTRLARRLALGEEFSDARFEPYARAGRAFRRVQVTRLARDVGGGECGPAPSSFVASAALELAGSRFAYEVLGDLALGSRLAAASRQNLLAAHELCAREAEARIRNQGSQIAREQAEFQRQLAARLKGNPR